MTYKFEFALEPKDKFNGEFKKKGALLSVYIYL